MHEEFRSLATIVDSRAEISPERPAYLGEGPALSWRAYRDRSIVLAAALIELGFDPGERVAVLLPDGPEVHIAFSACERAGVVAVGIGSRAGESELSHLLRLTGATGWITAPTHQGESSRELHARLRADGLPLEHHLVVASGEGGALSLEVDGVPYSDSGMGVPASRALRVDDLFLLNSTSGTTGLPKCVMHDLRRWHSFHRFAVRAGALDSSDVFMSVVPAPFGFGIWTAHVTPTLLGVPTVLMQRFEAGAALRLIERHRVSVLAAVSTQFIMMLGAREIGECDLSSLRVLFTGGEAVPRKRAEAFEEATRARVLQFYGSNEVGAVSATTLSDPRDKRLTTAGRPIPEMNLRLFDAEGHDVSAAGRGQPACYGPTLSLGYYGDDAANASLRRDDGWMLLGDVVSLDAEGYLSVVGRSDDFIIRGGKNISAAAVEDAVSTHPAVCHAAAVAMPDPIFGERVCAYVELQPDSSLELDALVAHLLERSVSKEILPERLVVMDELPRSSGGKLAKQVLREHAKRRGATDVD